MNAWLEIPRGWLDSFGEIARFGSRVAGLVYSGRVFRFFGESLRQAGILILGSALVIWGLVFVLGLQCGIEGAYLLRAQGAPAYAGLFSAWCDLREILPYAFGYMLAAKVGTGIVAELGAMRISDEIDALEVMGIRSVAYLASTRVLAGLLVVIPLYCIGVLASFWAARFGTTVLYGQSTGVYDHYFRTFLNPTDLIWSFVQCVALAVVIMLIHTYYGFTASGGPAGVGEAVGRAVRTSLIFSAFVLVMISLAVYGQSGNFNLAG